jgi:hypothetical protein
MDLRVAGNVPSEPFLGKRLEARCTLGRVPAMISMTLGAPSPCARNPPAASGRERPARERGERTSPCPTDTGSRAAEVITPPKTPTDFSERPRSTAGFIADVSTQSRVPGLSFSRRTRSAFARGGNKRSDTPPILAELASMQSSGYPIPRDAE